MAEDAGEFDDWAQTHGPALLRFAYLVTQDSHDAEDVTQEALLSTYRHWPRVRRMADPGSYCRRCAVNAAKDRWRRYARRETPADLRERSGEGATPDHGSSVDEADAAWRLCLTLPPGQRAVLVLRYYEDLSVEQIARVLHRRPGTVRSQISRALSALRAGQPQSTQEAAR